MNIVVTGSLGFDYIMDFPGFFKDRIMPDKIHILSLSFLVDKLNKQFGGTAGNIAYSLKLFGTNSLILAACGNDFSPYKKHLQKYRLSTQYIEEYKTETTGSYFVVTDKADNQIGAFYIGATKYNKDLSLTKINKKINYVVISANDPTAMKKYVRECNVLKLPYVYDPSFQIENMTPAELKKGLAGAAVFIGNDYEVALIKKKLAVSHQELFTFTPIVVTTLGPEGSIVEDRNKRYMIKPVRAKKSVDPTGAGDAYRAGFLWGLVNELDLKTCGQMGSVAAVYAVENYGTQAHEYTVKEFVKRYEESYGKELKFSV